MFAWRKGKKRDGSKWEWCPANASHAFVQQTGAARCLCALGRALTEGGQVCADGNMSPLSALVPSEVNLVGCWPALSLLSLLKKGDSGALPKALTRTHSVTVRGALSVVPGTEQ